MKNQKAHTIWNRNVKRISQKRLSNMRLEIGIPASGFQTDAEGQKWEKKEGNAYMVTYEKVKDFSNSNEKNEILKKKSFFKLMIFADELKSSCPEIKNGFDEAIVNLIIFDVVPDSILKKCNVTGCDIEFVTAKTKVIGSGVYIRISEHTNIGDIRSFLDGSGHIINRYKELVYGKRRMRYRKEDFSKNEIIFDLGKDTLVELKDLYKAYGENEDVELLRSKDSVACAILARIGYVITPDNFRRILSREKKRRALM